MTDDSLALAARLRDGDSDALEALLQQHYPALRAYVRLHRGDLIRSKEDSTDIVQSVCREVLQQLHHFRFAGEDGFRRWLFTTATRKICDRYDYYLAAKRDVRLENAPPSGSRADLLDRYGSFCTPSRVAEAREEIARIEAAFDRLSERYREVILLARVVGLSRAAIAEHLGSTEGAIRTLLTRVTAKLAGLLDTAAEPPD